MHTTTPVNLLRGLSAGRRAMGPPHIGQAGVRTGAASELKGDADADDGEGKEGENPDLHGPQDRG
jgi:hypothetical protein